MQAPMGALEDMGRHPGKHNLADCDIPLQEVQGDDGWHINWKRRDLMDGKERERKEGEPCKRTAL
jgi:hypothetical protein